MHHRRPARPVAGIGIPVLDGRDAPGRLVRKYPESGEEESMTKVFKKESEVAWENHFMVDGAKLQWLYTKEKDDSPITVMKVLLQKGVTLPDHRHPDQPDLIYPLKGKATMFIEGEGEFPLEPGMIVQVPQNALHAIRRVEEELLLYNVFAPGTPYRPGKT
jgi:quercetin dioxygenase-like cupin family protein